MAFGANLFILTGAPGSGKTAILSRLRRDFRCEDEPAREVLAEQRATGGIGTWDQDPILFVHLLLRRSIQKYRSALRSGRTVLFDRGIPDCVVYALRAEADPTPSLAALQGFRYHPDVPFLEPWSAIYRTDEERIMSFDHTVSFSRALADVYEKAGYGLVCVPRGSIADRVAFVLEFISNRTQGASTPDAHAFGVADLEPGGRLRTMVLLRMARGRDESPHSPLAVLRLGPRT